MQTFFSPEDKQLVITTKIYGTWQELVFKFVSELIQSYPQKIRVDAMNKWINDEGTEALEEGEHQYFMQKKEQYAQADNGWSNDLVTLAKEQVAAGFRAWFELLATNYPDLNLRETEKNNFDCFLSNCIDSKYELYFGLRAKISYDYVKNPPLPENAFNWVIKQFQLIIIPAQCTIEAMTEYHNKKQNKEQTLTASSWCTIA